MFGNKRAIANIDNNCIHSEDVHELLRITRDIKLAFENHTNNLYKKASQKLNVLARTSNSLAFDIRKVIMNTFIKNQIWGQKFLI